MNHLLHLLSFDLRLLHRNRLFVLAAAVALIYVGVFYLIRTLGNLETMLIILIFNDPVVTGYLFAGVLLLFDKNQHTLQALAVLPVPFRLYLLSKAVVLAVLATGLAFAMALATVGWAFQPVHLFFATFLSAFIFSCIGFYVGAYAKNFNHLLFYSIPFLVVAGLPFLALFGIGSWAYFFPIPSTGGIVLLQASFTDLSLMKISLGYLHLIVWAGLSWTVAVRTTERRLL